MTVLLTFPVTGVEYNNEESEIQTMEENRPCQMADLWNTSSGDMSAMISYYSAF